MTIRSWQNFLRPGFRTKFQKKVWYPYFVDTRISLCQYRIGKRKLYGKNQLDQSRGFDGTPTCDRHRQTQSHSKYRASIASSGKTIMAVLCRLQKHLTTKTISNRLIVTHEHRVSDHRAYIMKFSGAVKRSLAAMPSKYAVSITPLTSKVRQC